MARELPRTLRSLEPGPPGGHLGRRLRGDRRRQRFTGAGGAGGGRRRWRTRCASSVSTLHQRRPRARRTSGSAWRGIPRGPDRRRRSACLAGPARRSAAGGSTRRPTRHHRACLPPRRGAAHASGGGGLRPSGRGRAARRVRVGGRRLPALRDQHTGGLVPARTVRPHGREQQPVLPQGDLGRARLASTSTSSSPAGAWSTTTSTAVPVSCHPSS